MLKYGRKLIDVRTSISLGSSKGTITEVPSPFPDQNTGLSPFELPILQQQNTLKNSLKSFTGCFPKFQKITV